MNIRRIKKWLPTRENIQSLRLERYLGHRINRSGLWSTSRYGIAKAVGVGLFCAFLPIPFQMIIAAMIAFWLGANLPISVLLVWITNPLTLAFIYTPPYLLGAYLLGKENISQQDFSMHVLAEHYLVLWVGGIIFSIVFGLLGFLLTNEAWKFVVSREWLNRRRRRKNRNKNRPSSHSNNDNSNDY